MSPIPQDQALASVDTVQEIFLKKETDILLDHTLVYTTLWLQTRPKIIMHQFDTVKCGGNFSLIYILIYLFSLIWLNKPLKQTTTTTTNTEKRMKVFWVYTVSISI